MIVEEEGGGEKARAEENGKAVLRVCGAARRVAAKKAAGGAREAKAKEMLRVAGVLAAEKSKEKKAKIDEVVGKASFSEFIAQNVGMRAVDIIKLINVPQTDESVAAELGMKINEVRRILNVLNSYGVARYDTNKDSKGWLTFRWCIDGEKLMALRHHDRRPRSPRAPTGSPEDCNDFFYCDKCYDEQKVILPFDAAFENQFKCDVCGRKLKRLNRDEAASLFERGGDRAPLNKALIGLSAFYIRKAR